MTEPTATPTATPPATVGMTRTDAGARLVARMHQDAVQPGFSVILVFFFLYFLTKSEAEIKNESKSLLW